MPPERIRALIVDDEPLARACVRLALRDEPSRRGGGGMRRREVGGAGHPHARAGGNYVLLHAGPKTHRIRLTLGSLARRLDATFAQVHRSAIVNLDKVREVQAWFGGDYIALLRTGEQLRVSRTHAPRLLRPAR